MHNLTVSPNPPPGCNFIGIDVSHHTNNGRPIDWDVVLNDSSIQWVFVKATEGLDWLDPQFSYNVEQLLARKDKVKIGAFQYYLPWDDGEAQANFFNSVIKKHHIASPSVPLAIDIEEIRNTSSTEFVINFCKFLDTADRNDMELELLYTGPSFWNKYFDPFFCQIVDGRLALWQAEYETSKLKPVNCYDVDKVGLWQYSEKGEVTGISREPGVDLNCMPNVGIARPIISTTYNPPEQPLQQLPEFNVKFAIDVSSQNGYIDWGNVSLSTPRIESLIVRASYGLTTDTRFSENIVGPIGYFVPRFCYHELNFNLNCEKQGDLFSSIVDRYDCGRVVTIANISESTSTLDMIKCLSKFAKCELRDFYYSIGTTKKVWDDHFDSYFCANHSPENGACSDYQFSNYDNPRLWLLGNGEIPNCWQDWTIKRYGQGYVRGIIGPVHLNHWKSPSLSHEAQKQTAASYQTRKLMFIDEIDQMAGDGFDSIIVDALKQGAFHGVLAEISAQLSYQLKRNGIVKTNAQISEKIFYYSLWFAARCYVNFSQVELSNADILAPIYSAFSKSIADIAILAGVNLATSVASNGMGYLAKFSSNLGIKSIPQCFKVLSTAVSQLPFAFGVFNSGVTSTATAVVSGFFSRKIVKGVFSMFGSTLLNNNGSRENLAHKDESTLGCLP